MLQEFSFSDRKQLIEGYSQTIRQKIDEGFEPSFINFMFNHIGGGEKRSKEIMKWEVERVYEILSRHMLRKPKSERWKDKRPVFIGCPDFPVFKYEKSSLRDVQVNGGLHFNVVCLAPRRGTNEPLPHRYTVRRRSRLKVSVKEHFQNNAKFYRNENLYRVHVTPITEKTMADYTLKAFKNGNLSYDDILILN